MTAALQGQGASSSFSFPSHVSPVAKEVGEEAQLAQLTGHFTSWLMHYLHNKSIHVLEFGIKFVRLHVTRFITNHLVWQSSCLPAHVWIELNRFPPTNLSPPTPCHQTDKYDDLSTSQIPMLVRVCLNQPSSVRWVITCFRSIYIWGGKWNETHGTHLFLCNDSHRSRGSELKKTPNFARDPGIPLRLLLEIPDPHQWIQYLAVTQHSSLITCADGRIF